MKKKNSSTKLKDALKAAAKTWKKEKKTMKKGGDGDEKQEEEGEGEGEGEAEQKTVVGGEVSAETDPAKMTSKDMAPMTVSGGKKKKRKGAKKTKKQRKSKKMRGGEPEALNSETSMSPDKVM